MSTLRSTMGAPLTDEEEFRIRAAWNNLRQAAIPTAFPIQEPVEMLHIITDIVGKCWEVRRAIDDAWHYANKRAFPDPVTKPRKRREDLAVTLAALDATDEELAEAIAEVRGEHK